VKRADETESNQIFISGVDIIDSINVKGKNVEIFNKVDTKDSLFLVRVKSIPLDVFERVELKYLSVWGQDCDIYGEECLAISELPKEIEKLKNLEELRLTLNYIERLPLEILKLEKLRILDLSENPNFSDVGTVTKMAQLEEFYCFGCHLSKSDINILKSRLPNCKIGTE
jgi:hypothetical protein